jgi:hypothetical protein
MTDFLPTGYDVPSSSDKYYKFAKGENRFRIMSSPIMGYEYWVTENGNRRPVRVPMGTNIDTSLLETNPKTGEVDLPKHFWAMVVYDYVSEKAKILEITQKGVMKALTTLAKDDDWGSPVGNDGYDIVVSKEGDGYDTEYTVNPKPRKKLDAGIEQFVQDHNINLNALFSGEDPFTSTSKQESKNIQELTEADM